MTLWDAGFEELRFVDDELARERLAEARDVLGAPSISQLRSVGFWQQRLGVSESEFADFLSDLGFVLSPAASKLPKGALKALQDELLRDSEVASRAAVADADVMRSEEREKREDPVPPAPPLEWETIGWEKDVDLLAVEDVLHVHHRLVVDALKTDDPISPPGVKSRPLLESAVSRPGTSLSGALKYKTVEMAAAALLHSLVHNHPFHNGNKRTALVSMIAMLDRNNLIVTADQDQLFRFMLRIAQHRLVNRRWNHLADREVLVIAEWVRGNSRQLAKDERPLKWRELKQLLRDYGCTFSTPKTGNRINIERRVRRPGGLLRRSRTESLSCQAFYPDDGSEVERNTIHMIRRELELDEEHDVDSEVFYGDAEIDDFILRYRKILRELAKL